MEAAAAAAVEEPVDVDVWGTDGALADVERALVRFATHRDHVSRAATGHVGSAVGAKLSASAAHMTVAIRSLEDGVHRLRAVRDGTAGAAPHGERQAAVSAAHGIAPPPITVEGGAAVPESPLNIGDEAFPVPVSADSDPFARQFLNVRPTSSINDLTRAAIERLGLEHHTGTWALHLEGRPLTDQLTAADAGLRRGSELVLLQIG